MKTYQRLQVAWIILAAATACLAAVSLCLAWTAEDARRVAGMEEPERRTMDLEAFMLLFVAGAGGFGCGVLLGMDIGRRREFRRLLKQWPEQGGPVNPGPPRAPRRDVRTP